MKLNIFKFTCKECEYVYEDEEIEAKTMESECPMCGNWEYSEKPSSSKNGYNMWGRRTESER